MRPSGHIVVLGTAGSGKTTVAALRAQMLSNPQLPHCGKTLLVTYNQSLVTYLRTIASKELKHVTVETFHKFAFGYLNSKGKMTSSTIIPAEERLNLIRKVVLQAKLTIGGDDTSSDIEILKELLSREFTMIARVGMSRKNYLEDSSHKDMRLTNAIGEEVVYDALESYKRLRDKNGQRFDYDDSLTEAWKIIQQDSQPRLYKHIVIDEGQDFAPVMLKTLIAAVPADGSVSFFGDVAQQIYGRETNWREAGFKVDHPELFEQNIRNTIEVARLGVAISEMPYFCGVPDLVPARIGKDEGPPPTLVRLDSAEQELVAICQQAISAVNTQNVAIICPSTEGVKKVLHRLEKLKVKSVVHLERITRWYPEEKPQIYVSNYYNAKGLEFGAVILAFISKKDMPGEWLESIYGKLDAASRSGSHLYVGVTRCKRSLVMTYHGEVTHLLPPSTALLHNTSLAGWRTGRRTRAG